MKEESKIFILVALLAQCQGAVVKIHLNQPGKPIGPTLWGISLEDVNHALDGGLYGELILNRGLSPRWPADSYGSPFPIQKIVGYSVINSDSVDASISLSTAHPLNSILNTSIHLNISSEVPEGKRAGVANKGFSGIPILSEYTFYRASFYAKVLGSDFTGPLTVSIENVEGTVTYATAQVSGISTDFEKYEVILTPNVDLIQVPSSDNIFTISAYGPVPKETSIYFNMISLFPPTFKNRTNGMRIDLAEKIAAMNPSFARLPGGIFLRGHSLEHHFNWTNSIGDITLRPGHMGNCAWYTCSNAEDFYTTDGMGILEMFQFTEDLNISTVVLGVYAGYSNDTSFVQPSELGPFVESALNEIEYLIGNTSTQWGAKRAEHGHPEPFSSLKYVEIGSWREDNMGNRSKYWERYEIFEKAIKEKYPELKVASTAFHGVSAEKSEVALWEKHSRYDWLIEESHYFDDFTSTSNVSELIVSHFAWANGEIMSATLTGAIVDAVAMIGMERNCDLVVMASHAHLAGLGHNFTQLRFRPNAIQFDSIISYYTPPGWVQQLFGSSQGDMLITTDVLGTMVFAGANLDSQNNVLNVRVVNANWIPTAVAINLLGIEETHGGTRTVLTGLTLNDENDKENPLRVSPQQQSFGKTDNEYSFIIPSISVVVLRFCLDENCNLN